MTPQSVPKMPDVISERHRSARDDGLLINLAGVAGLVDELDAA
jgi:hypothetical protein